MSPDQITAPDRERTKRVVYAVVYGVGELVVRLLLVHVDVRAFGSAGVYFMLLIGKEKLAEFLTISTEAAQELMAHFLSKKKYIYIYITTKTMHALESCPLTLEKTFFYFDKFFKSKIR